MGLLRRDLVEVVVISPCSLGRRVSSPHARSPTKRAVRLAVRADLVIKSYVVSLDGTSASASTEFLSYYQGVLPLPQ